MGNGFTLGKVASGAVEAQFKENGAPFFLRCLSIGLMSLVLKK